MGASLLAAAEAATALVTSQWEPAPSQWEGCDFPLGSLRLPTGKAATSQWELRKSHWEIPLGAFRAASGTFNERLEKRVGARGARLAHPTGTLAFGEAPSPGPTRRREAPSACSHWEAAPLPCARHFLWGTFLVHGFRGFSNFHVQHAFVLKCF